MCLRKRIEVIITKRKYIIYLLMILASAQGYLGYKQWITNRTLDNAHSVYESLEAPTLVPTLLNDNSAREPDQERSLTETTETPAVGSFSYKKNPMSSFIDINPDYVGHLTLTGTSINYPVVKARDNAYYLNHNFYREKDALGSIFMDYRNIGMHLDKHTILYGHYTEQGYMFGDLEKYLDEEFLLKNQIIEFSTPQGVKLFRIFSIHISPKETPYLDIAFQKTTYADFLSSLSAQSILDDLEIPDKTKKLLTLSTCNYAIRDGRLFIHAIEIDSPL